VKDNGCTDVHRKFNPRDVLPPGWTKFKKGERFALWQCVVSFRRLTLPVAVAVDDSTGAGRGPAAQRIHIPGGNRPVHITG
jgi:hypothetical protein